VATTPADAVVAPRATWRHYYELTKPKVVLLIVFTAIVGTLLATAGDAAARRAALGQPRHRARGELRRRDQPRDRPAIDE
jgi:hypothetical protein